MSILPCSYLGLSCLPFRKNSFSIQRLLPNPLSRKEPLVMLGGAQASVLSSNSTIQGLPPPPHQSIGAEITESSESAVLKRQAVDSTAAVTQSAPSEQKSEALCVQRALCTCTYPCLIRFLQGRCYGSASRRFTHTKHPGKKSASEIPKLVGYVPKHLENCKAVRKSLSWLLIMIKTVSETQSREWRARVDSTECQQPYFTL